MEMKKILYLMEDASLQYEDDEIDQVITFREKLIFLGFCQKSLPFPVDKHFFMGYSMYHTYKLIQML